MIQLVPNGPYLPEEIEQALRNDELVFFCGAGVSAQNGLPSFKGLVEKVCKKLLINIDKEPLLKEAKKTKSYDGILDIVEGNQDFSVERKALRKKVIRILSQTQGEPEIHKSLLELSALPDDRGHRLVTTNFDRLFFEAGLKPELADIAPKLAPPRKKEAWKNLTFLHGVIDEQQNPDGASLVLTRKDFGLAYFYDGWAARFIIQLFQDWTVLFIGYSADDPVVSYLLSAISYENQRRRANLKASSGIKKGGIKPSIYAFAGYETGKEEETRNKWTSKGIEPVLYKKQENDHSLLYKTIKEWAEQKKTGLRGKKHWLKEHLKGSCKETDKGKAQTFISRLKTDQDIAEYFPQINYSESSDSKKFKPADISWLNAFSESTFSEPTGSEKKKPKSNSLLAPRPKAPAEKNFLEKLNFRTKAAQTGRLAFWEPLTRFEIAAARWLLHHLDKKELIHWLIDKLPRGAISLHPEFKRMIELKLRAISNPKETLGERQFLFWQILMSQKERLNAGIGFGGNFLMHDIKTSYSHVKMQRLLHALEPYIVFEKHFSSKKLLKLEGRPDIDTIYKPALMIDMDYYPSRSEIKNEDVLLRHAEDFSDLLKKAMELASFSGIIQNGEDPFFILRPSIASHSQNRNFESWLYLIDLARESFDAALKKDTSLAGLLLSKWQRSPFSLFQRLILYAVTEHKELDAKPALDLFKKNPSVLWSVTCRHEVLKYLSGRAHSKKEAAELLDLIFKGPPRSMFKKDIDEKILTEHNEIEMHKRLFHIKISGAQLSKSGEELYQDIQKRYGLGRGPKDKNADSRKFPFYRTGPKILGSENRYHNSSNEEIFDDIKRAETDYDMQTKRENFREFVKKDPEGIKKGFEILSMFEDNDLNSAPFWSVFLFEISMSGDMQKGSEHFLKSLKKTESFNDSFIKECLCSLIHGLSQKAGVVYEKEGQGYFKKWWLKLWQLSAENYKSSEKESDFSSQSLNSNFGKLSEIIFQILWNAFPDSKSSKNAKMPKEIKDCFKIMIQGGKEKDPSALFNFGFYLWHLWHLDRGWTMESLKPLMDWKKIKTNRKAYQALWEGYFHRVLLSPDFATDFKEEFFHLLLYGKDLCKMKEGGIGRAKYQSALVEIFFILTGGRWVPNIFKRDKIEEIIRAFDDAGFWEKLARKIWVQLKDSEKEKSPVLWSEKIRPWIDNFWPPQASMKTHETAGYLSLASLHCGDKFPEALMFLKDKIEGASSENQGDIVYHIEKCNKKFDVFKNHPKELLQLLMWSFPERKICPFFSETIKDVLDTIKKENPKIEADKNYKNLREKLPE